MKKRTLLPESARKNAAPEQNCAYAAKLKAMVDCKTVWTADGANAAEFQRFYRLLEELFPNLHHKARRLTFGEGCFFYVVGGKDPQRNILLMSHHDVVDGGEGWLTNPFDATEKDGCLYGRGTVDTKTPLFAQLQAVEELLAEGYSFDGIELYIGSSNNEEVSGDGMVLATEYFRRQNIHFHAILDEGGAITTGMIPGVSAKSAVIAVHEKSRHLYKCVVRQQQAGHGGLNPTTGSPVQTMCRFISKVESSGIFRPAFAPEVRTTFTSHAPYMSFPLNVLFGNFGLFGPLIKKIMASIPQAAAMLATGATFTSIEGCNPAMPQMKAKEVTAWLFARCIREDTLEQEMAKVRKIGEKLGVEIEEVERDYCPPSSFRSQPYQVVEGLLHENFPDVITAPFLLTAGTDARRFAGLCDNILRFAPIDLNKEQFASIHSKNENITIQNIGQCVLFYKDFVKRI